MAIPSAMAITSAKQVVIPSATIIIIKLSHMWYSIFHMVSTSAYIHGNNICHLAITSAKHVTYHLSQYTTIKSVTTTSGTVNLVTLTSVTRHFGHYILALTSAINN